MLGKKTDIGRFLFIIIFLSCCCFCLLHLLDSIPQPKTDVCGGHPVWRVDWGTSAGSACSIHGLRWVGMTLSLQLILQKHASTHSFAGVFYYFNSILNPILYTILSKRFRRGFNDMSHNCWVYQVRPFNFKQRFYPDNFPLFNLLGACEDC